MNESGWDLHGNKEIEETQGNIRKVKEGEGK